MINHANPVIHPDLDTIIEYPVREWKNRQQHDHISDSFFVSLTDLSEVSTSYFLEDADLGHRHFSSLHWLFPGMFHPTPFHSKRIFLAAKKTLLLKAAAGSGHTGYTS
jgi:hypothetical protein